MVILPQLKTLENGQMQKMRVHKKLLIKPKVLYHNLCDDYAVMMMGKGCSIQYLGHALDTIHVRPSAASVGISHLYLTYY